MKFRQVEANRTKKIERSLRIGEFLRMEMTDLLRNKVRDPRLEHLSLSVADVRVSKDLGYADIYVGCYESSDEETERLVVDVLGRASGFFRSEIAKRHSMRKTPEIRFRFDRTAAEAAHIDALLAESRRT